jgi:anti-sigma B factor antagonist
MRLETEQIAPGVTKVNLTGRLDIGGSQEIELTFNALAGAQRALIIDLANVDFIASLGLRLLIVGARTTQRKGGRMVLLRPPIAVEAVLVSSGTDNVVPILRNLDEAIHAVSG